MELRQLRYFVVLAEELHFARAADRLGIAQPSLSTQIQVLEASLSAKLFVRGPRLVSLTAAGAIFLEEARLTLAQADRALTLGRRAGRGEIGQIRIGVALGSTLSGAPSIVMSQYRSQFPEIDVQLSILSPKRQLEALQGGSLDVGFLRPPSSPPDGVEFIKLFSEKHMVAMSANHPMAGKLQLVAADLAEEPFLVMSADASNGIFEATARFGRLGGFTPRIARIERDLISLLSLVGAGFGIILVTESVGRIAMPNVVYRPVKDLDMDIEIVAAYRADEIAKPVRSFLECSETYGRAQTVGATFEAVQRH